MSKKELTATKAGKKNGKQKVIKQGRGGYRPGAGRKATKNGDTQQIHTDTPLVLIEGMNKAGINNKTAYVNYLIACDLQTRDGLSKLAKSIAKVESDLADNYY